MTKPELRPKRPHFSSGPCAKHPGWSLKKIGTDSLGRSHRTSLGKARLKLCIDLMREVLQVPQGYRIGIVPASDTGAFEMAMWSLLGARPVDVLAWESFGQGWVTDAVKQLKLQNLRVLDAPYGQLPDLKKADTKNNDIVFTWNGTTSGVRVPNADWIDANRQGLTLCDATSAVFAQELDWSKLDVTTFSWQKALGGEGAHGVLILSPRAVERLESYVPSWPLPKLFRMTKGGRLIDGIFSGETINTPSMLCVEDYIDALGWAKQAGGLPALIKRSDGNAKVIFKWVKDSAWAKLLAEKPKTRSNTSVCLSFSEQIAKQPEDTQRALVKKIAALLEQEHAAFDIAGYRDAPPGLRIWCGATVNKRDVQALLPWLDWAFEQAKTELKLAA